MLFNPGKPAAWIAALLLACCPLSAAADVTAGVAAYQRKDFAGALQEFQQAAQRDDVRALIYLGIMHADGVGTPRNDSQAAMLFSKAAMLGSPEAMANLGRMHAEGRGMPQDNKAAVAAYSAAARSGFQPAMTRMAEIYEKGELGVTPDPALAREWRAQASGRPLQVAPAAVTQPPEPSETPDMVALARAARTQLQRPEAQAAEAAPLQAATPAAETITPAVATPQAVPAQEKQIPSLPATPPPVAVPAPEPIATVNAQPVPIQAQQTPALDTEPRQSPAPAKNVIESIAVTLQSGEIQVRVRTRTPLAVPPADFVVAAPPRIVFDFLNTSTGLGRYHEVGEGNLQSVDVISGDTRTRMVLILGDNMQHEARMEGGDLLIRLTPVPAPAAGSSSGNPSRRSSR